ncbi:MULTISPECIES: anthranilate phosphoribosyltransferase [Brevibacillus]|jgi:anthranilate phosphoribosyltransferase|uniref:Anthranilate phosphoribosyltransferase n=1 Tax=Brevibacillus parabrevis TaxID=54914 RepID=A0A4Y3PNQ6_BREPA|nr:MULTISPECIES: anthranilate phosphoribosyltransferase [Brevibacillus]MBU8712165.1 anthranilate phosphoribosyltransferase [Brevibacillus parabrevis]MDH6349233.1 anthranilate phosphoribosyltransferase [Brevibacillus sp. 1238]RNB96284.1 anthranilate phosphoribosyltransferase [Brevibacillus parabrevis]UED71463.1 anthranilate phosphoribosyltransferase [Brevibacillus sp. HD3.3A]GEB32729.1 anthranilate phosphoribosyltransferase [Brevibacillus parabrevis]
MLTYALEQILQGSDLTRAIAEEAMGEIMDGKATPAQIGAFLASMRLKGEQVEEIIGFAQAMRARAMRFPIDHPGLVDTCGTGGDGSNTFNISTASAIVAASDGVRIAKHGNRAVSSKSGSADVLEALGVPVNLSPKEAADCLRATNLCFLFAPLYHQAMKHAAGPRKELAVRTVFNLLGPLTNPANASHQLMGVYDAKLLPTVAAVLRELHVERALVVAGSDGLDELTVTGTSQIAELRDGQIRTYEIDPKQFGLRRHDKEALRGGDSSENAEIIRDVFAGKRGAARDIVLLNAGAILYLSDRVRSIEAGVIRAAELIDDGLVMRKLEHIRQIAGGMIHAS